MNCGEDAGAGAMSYGKAVKTDAVKPRTCAAARERSGAQGSPRATEPGPGAEPRKYVL